MFSDSALKVVFTTLYVDIKEPIAFAHSANKKTQFVARRSRSRDHAGTKLGSNLQSLMYKNKLLY